MDEEIGRGVFGEKGFEVFAEQLRVKTGLAQPLNGASARAGEESTSWTVLIAAIDTLPTAWGSDTALGNMFDCCR